MSMIGSRMRGSIAVVTMAVLSGLGWAAGQGRDADVPGPVIMSSDMDLLERFISLPVRPRPASFEMWEVGTPGDIRPSDQQFLALLRYSEAGFDAVRASWRRRDGPRGAFASMRRIGWARPRPSTP